MKDKKIHKKLPIDLGDGLNLRWATLDDHKELIELSFLTHDEADKETPFVRRFMEDWAEGKFPILRHEDITVVEDMNTRKIVSSMCLFSETWRYGKTPFKLGRPELVMTLEDYRRRGLIRKQFDVIHSLSEARGEVMQVITGIPSLYRDFGYELSLQLGGGYRIAQASFPPIKKGSEDEYRLRKPKTEAERKFIRELHEENTSTMLFSMDVPEETWAFEFDGYADGSDGKFEWLLIEDKKGSPLGYVQHNHIFWRPMPTINFMALKSGVGYLNLLPHLLDGLWQVAEDKLRYDTFKQPASTIKELYLRLGREHPLYDAVGTDLMLEAPAYAWFTRFPDEVAYLNAIKPELEKNLAKSLGAGFTGELKLNFYRRGVHLKFQEGQLEIESWQPKDGSDGDAHFPANSFWSLLCGQKRAAELHTEIADCWMTRTARSLLDCLFPEFTGQVWVVGGGA